MQTLKRKFTALKTQLRWSLIEPTNQLFYASPVVFNWTNKSAGLVFLIEPTNQLYLSFGQKKSAG